MPKHKKPIIGIVGGEGKMGSWFRGFFEREGCEVLISDRDTKISNKDLAKTSDIVVVSVPIKETKRVIREITPYLKKDALLTDFTSLKDFATREMKKAKCAVLGMHPLFGPLTSDLKSQTIVFCKIGKKENKWIRFLKNLFEKNGAKIIEISPQKHDFQMAFLQGLLHFSVISFSYFLKTKRFKPNPYFLTPMFRLQSLLIGRLFAQKPDICSSLEIENPHFKKVLRDYIKTISEFQKIIEKKDYRGFEEKFIKARNYFSDYVKIAQKKSQEVLEVLREEPIRIGSFKKINLKKAKIGFLGPEGTFSWIGAKKVFPKTPASFFKPFQTIKEIFEAISREEIDFGVVPIENSIAGLVSETMHSFVYYPVYILASFRLPIHHCLASRGKELSQLKIVRSHPQALSQCRNWLDKNLPFVVREQTPSTISDVAGEFSQEVGFIVPCESAKKLSLNVLSKNIEDKKSNFTRFFIISHSLNKKMLNRINPYPASTLFLLSVYDRVGILRDILDVFAKRDINLKALHSIPSYFLLGDYLFFLEFEKSYFSKETAFLIRELEQFCPIIRVLGVGSKEK